MTIIGGVVLAILVGIPAFLKSGSPNTNSPPSEQDEARVQSPLNAGEPQKAVPGTVPAHYETFTEAEIRGLVYSRVSRVLKISVEQVDPNMNVIDGKNIDSLHAVEMVIAIEDATRCPIPDDVAEKIVTVEDIIEATVNSCKQSQ